MVWRIDWIEPWRFVYGKISSLTARNVIQENCEVILSLEIALREAAVF